MVVQIGRQTGQCAVESFVDEFGNYEKV